MNPRKLFRATLICLLVLSVLILAAFSFSSSSTAQVGLPRTSLPSAPAGPATPLWRDVDPSLLAHLALKREIVPQRYRTVAVDSGALLTLLSAAPLENGVPLSQSSAVLTLPMPDGSSQRFRIENSPIMAPALAAKHSGIKTYRGQGVDDPTATARFGWTTAGFHAIVLSGTGTTYIDRYAKGDLLHYISYYKRDYKSDKRFSCLFKGKSSVVPAPAMAADAAPPPVDPNGTIRRTYRLALAANFEYSDFHSDALVPDKADVLNKGIVPTMNRVNAIYERDFAVHMNLVPNEEDIIFNTPADPYVNESPEQQLFTNPSVLDGLVGVGNYDIGHVFTTGGGGIAGLGVVCSTATLGHKAEGVTGNSSPTADSFDVDYVAHEMGHQFGGNHTFNGTLGSCSGSNRNAATAYEVGSGSTIMAYAGICGVQNTQPHSDDPFHNASYREIQNFISIGGGNACDAPTTTGNTPPTVDAGPHPSSTPSFFIPARTPFALTAVGADADPGDVAGLTYNWDEFDLGPAGDGNTDNGSSPILRSFDSSTSPTRTFPRLSDLLNNVSTYGEKLPTTSRKMDFCVTVRDNRAGSGGVDYDCVRVQVETNAGGFKVVLPNGGESWTGGGMQTVTWDVSNTATAPISTANVNIRLSTDGGLTYPHVLATNVPNDGSQSVAAPNIATGQARVKVEGAGNIFFDISNNNFAITASVGPPVAGDDAATTAIDTPVTIAVLANDSDPTGDPIAITSVQSPTTNGGTAVVNNNGTSEPGDDRIVYTPATGFSGTDTFTYAITAGGQSDSALVTVTVLASGVPVAVDDAASTNVNVPVMIAVLANDFDPNDPLAITAVDSPTAQGGTATINNNGTPGNTTDDRILFTPAGGFTGVDTFNYTITGGGQTDSALVTVTVDSGCPPLTNGSFTDDFEPPQTPGWTVETAVNTIPVSEAWGLRADPAAHSGTNSYNSDASATDLKDDRLISPSQDLSSLSKLIFWHRYTFETGFDGGVLEISTDGGATWVDVGPENSIAGGYTDVIETGYDSPIAGRAAWSGQSPSLPNMNRVEVNLGAYAGTGRKLRWRLANDNGVLVPEGTRWWIDDVQFTNLLVENDNCPLPPTPVDDTATTNEDTAKIINVVANDTDPNGDTLTVTAVTDAPHGSVINNGNGTVTYTPDPNYFGPDSFGYTVCDPGPLCTNADVNMTVTSVNDNPQATNDNATVNENSGPNTIDVLRNDSDAPDSGETLTIQSVTQGANGAVVITDGGSLLTYQPNAGFDGNDSFTYTASDGNGGTATATVAVQVIPVSGLVNYALTALGSVPSASSTFTDRNYSVTSAFDGEVAGANWEQGGGWNDNTRGLWPDNLDVTFGGGAKTISEIRVYTLQNNFRAPVTPDQNTDASTYGILDFQMQTWNGTAWVTVPGGTITGNTKALRVITLGTPITTTKVRVLVTNGRVYYSRIVELEAYGAAGQ
jgi:hypothetical protein